MSAAAAQPQGHHIVASLAKDAQLPISADDFPRVAEMVEALWRSGARIRCMFGDDVAVAPLTAVPDQFAGGSE